MLLGNNEVGFALGSYNPTLPMVIDPVLSYSTYLGGSLGDIATGVAVNTAGDIYITGETGSSDFPVSSGAYQHTIDGGNTVTDIFVTELNPQGQIVYSTFLGGSSDDHGTGIAVNTNGDAYICGFSYSSDYPTTTGAVQRDNNGGYDSVVTELNPTGTASCTRPILAARTTTTRRPLRSTAKRTLTSSVSPTQPTTRRRARSREASRTAWRTPS